MQRLYLRLSNKTCTLDSKTGIWTIQLPSEFSNSNNPDKKITVINFMYYAKLDPPTDTIPIILEYNTFHCPTLCDGNYNQDNYIATLCSTYNTVYKTYPIKSKPKVLEFYFKDSYDDIIKVFFKPKGYDWNYNYYENFSIDLELIY